MKNIAIYKATLDNEELNQIRSVLESKNDLSKVLEFEEKMTKYIGAKYAIATSTSTAIGKALYSPAYIPSFI